MNSSLTRSSQRIIHLIQEAERYYAFHPRKWKLTREIFEMVETDPVILEHPRFCKCIAEKIKEVQQSIDRFRSSHLYHEIESHAASLMAHMQHVQHMIESRHRAEGETEPGISG